VLRRERVAAYEQDRRLGRLRMRFRIRLAKWRIYRQISQTARPCISQ